MAILGMTVSCAGPALAQDSPCKPVRIVVPYLAGRPVDALPQDRHAQDERVKISGVVLD
ncbi:hypothetical protein [Variovorax sp. YR216]|uniref:hypothetical protein n=1 Tax=Variovorax sp. YR216 TaxID=1882828 RepID=UPI000898A385|nr:hypothetical protein [Variovorax sp. YR216]SEB25878.1 hypothetical protein SAMN05444680_1287 [Variovorax sp. YR216]